MGVIQRVVEVGPTLVVTDTVELAVFRRIDVGTELHGAVLTGARPGQATGTAGICGRRRGGLPSCPLGEEFG